MAPKGIRRNANYIEDRQRWRASYWPPGATKPVTKSTFLTKREANAWLDEQIAAIVDDRWVEPEKGRMTLHSFFHNHFVPTFEGDDNTLSGYKSGWKHHLDKRWGDSALADVERADIRQWRANELPKLSKAGNRKGTLGQSAQKQLYWLFHSVMALAEEDGYITRSPFPEKSGLPEIQSTKVDAALEPHQLENLATELRALTAAHRPRYRANVVVKDWGLMNYALIYTFGYGGFRLGEGTGLRIDDCDFEHCAIAVDEQLKRSNGTYDLHKKLKRQRSQRRVPMPPEVMDMIEEHIDVNIGWDNPHALIFTTPEGTPLLGDNWSKRWLYPAAVNAGLGRLEPNPDGGRPLYRGLTAHDLRHTAASAWFDEGWDVAAVAEFLGDSLQVTRDTYIHLFESKHKELIAERMGKRIARGKRDAANGNVLPMRYRRPS